eukprot:COSAG06_NODE_787_length_12291_cov_18.133694_3_plen_243_part_00
MCCGAQVCFAVCGSNEDGERLCVCGSSLCTRALPAMCCNAQLLNVEGCKDLCPVVMSDAADDESADPEGTEVPFVIDGEVLHVDSIVSGDGSTLPDISARLAIGRNYVNRLYRTYSNEKLDLDLRLSMFQACVIGTAFYTDEVYAKVNGWASRMLSAITERTAHEEASDPATNVVARFESRQLKAVAKILRGDDESPARIALLKILRPWATGARQGSLVMRQHVAPNRTGRSAHSRSLEPES